MKIAAVFIVAAASFAAALLAPAAQAAAPELIIASGGKTEAVVVVAPEAGLPETKAQDGTATRGIAPAGTRNGEWKAAADLVKYIELMTGAKPRLVFTRAEIDAALKGAAPVILVGEEAIKARPDLAKRLAGAAKKNPVLAADAIALLRDGGRLYLAGSNDDAHYFAAAELLWRWGCRFYIPTEFGECVPDVATLKLGDLDYAYGSPFEIRSYWISWVGDGSGREEFQRRNMMITHRRGFPSTGHALGQYTGDVAGSKGTFNFPITAPETAAHVAKKLADRFAKGEDISVGMEDGSYDSDYPKDVELMKLQWDKYFMRWSVTDPMLELYNNVARILQNQFPNSKAKLGFLAYANMTIPPVREMKAERSLFCELAPIDIDPIHGMDDQESPPRQEYRDMLYKWAKIMDGRLAIYDYDQGMLVWRDFPNPSHQGLKQDFAHYAKAGILGVNTESRNAIGTTFLNLFFRGRLMWNPGEDIDALLKEFYPKFYGPAAAPMETYWSTIYKAWNETIITEHEYFVAPAIYTPEVIETCRKSLLAAEKIVAPLKKKAALNRHEKLLLDRMKFTRMSFDIMDGYLGMVQQAATEIDYAKAAQIGKKALAVREQMTDMSGIFTTYRRYGEGGPAWWPGEVAQYAKLDEYVNGPAGKIVAKLPLEWAFRRDPKDLGLKEGWGLKAPDLSYWKKNRAKLDLRSRKDYPVSEWEVVRSDLYLQAQGIRHPDRQSYTGHGFYATEVELSSGQASRGVNLMFPGLFNECWLYVNGKEVAYRKAGAMWWLNDYKFEWDVDLTGKLGAGKSLVTLRINNPHHFGGMFRRPFLYTPLPKPTPEAAPAKK